MWKVSTSPLAHLVPLNMETACRPTEKGAGDGQGREDGSRWAWRTGWKERNF